MYDVSTGSAMPPAAWPDTHVPTPVPGPDGPAQNLPDVVADLESAGWHSHRDLRGQGRALTEIDYVIVGRGGVFVVDSHSWSPTPAVPGSPARAPDEALVDVQRVTSELRGLLPPLTRQYVVPVLVHADPRLLPLVSQGVQLCTTATLTQVICSRMKVLSLFDVDQVEACLSANFGEGAARTEAPPPAVRDNSSTSRTPSKESRADRRAAKKEAARTAQAARAKAEPVRPAEPEPPVAPPSVVPPPVTVTPPAVAVPAVVPPPAAVSGHRAVNTPSIKSRWANKKESRADRRAANKESARNSPATVEPAPPVADLEATPTVEHAAPAVELPPASASPAVVSALPRALAVPLSPLTASVYVPQSQPIAAVAPPALPTGSPLFRGQSPPLDPVLSDPKDTAPRPSRSPTKAALPTTQPAAVAAEPKEKGPPVWKELTVLVLLAGVIGYGGIHHEAVTAWISEHVKSSPVEPSGPHGKDNHNPGDPDKIGTTKHDQGSRSGGSNNR